MYAVLGRECSKVSPAVQGLVGRKTGILGYGDYGLTGKTFLPRPKVYKQK